MSRYRYTDDWDDGDDDHNYDQNYEQNYEQKWESQYSRPQEATRLELYDKLYDETDDEDGYAAEQAEEEALNNLEETEELLDSRGRFMARVHGWMLGGLGVTAALSWGAAHTPEIMAQLKTFITPLCIAEVLMVLVMTKFLREMPAVALKICFIVYAAMTGITLAPIFYVATVPALTSTLAITAAMFASLSLYGFFTRRSLSGLGTFCLMGLVGVLLGSIVNFFLHSPSIDFIINCSGIVVFAGLTAFDTQKLIKIHKKAYADKRKDQKIQKMAIMGALTLYLDFVNLFLKLLALLGRRR